jgi:hypothetical protein
MNRIRLSDSTVDYHFPNSVVLYLSCWSIHNERKKTRTTIRMVGIAAFSIIFLWIK